MPWLITSWASTGPAGDEGAPPPNAGWVWCLLSVLDLAIVVTVGATLAFILCGPVETWLFSIKSASKPLLQAFVLGSLRSGIRRHSWLTASLAASCAAATNAHRRLARGSAWAPALTDAAIAVVSTRLATKAVAFAANLAFPTLIQRSMVPPFDAARFAETFAAWDSAWYLDIAQTGYAFRPDSQSNIAFFPLYPMLIRTLAVPFGGTERAAWLSGIAISYVCFFAALVLLHRLTAHMVGRREAARRAVLYAAVFPFSFPFTRIYTESLFLLVSVAAVWLAVRGRWSWAGVCGGLAALTRPNGILIAIPLGLMALQSGGGVKMMSRRVAALQTIPAALGAYCLFALTLSGDPLAWLNAQRHWGYSIGHAPWAIMQSTLETIEAQGLYAYLVSSEGGIYGLSHALIGLAVIALIPSIFSRLGPALGCYVAAGILIPFSSNALEGIGRYASTLFPVFMYLGATVRSRRLHEALLVGASLWLALNIALFVTQRPVY